MPYLILKKKHFYIPNLNTNFYKHFLNSLLYDNYENVIDLPLNLIQNVDIEKDILYLSRKN